MITTVDLAWMRAIAGQALPDSATVVRPGGSPDAMGGSDNASPTNVATNVPCRVDPADEDGAEPTAGGGTASALHWRLTLPSLTDARAQDTVAVTSARWTGTRTFQVDGVLEPRSWEITRSVACTELLD